VLACTMNAADSGLKSSDWPFWIQLVPQRDGSSSLAEQQLSSLGR